VIVESGVLPEGAFQFVVSSPGDLVDQMGPQDVLAFTGSSQTGRILRGNPAVIEHNIHVNIEADSLNAAVLGPDVDSDSETYGLLLSNLRTDMTQKSGQKCTAVRRIFVPEDRMQEVAADLMAELKRVKQGNPADAEVRMGPLASKEALATVRAGIAALAAEGKLLCGGVDAVQDKGYFVAPTLIEANSSDADIFHAIEVFGPVATLIPYDGSAEEAIRLVNRGGGGLVASLYSDKRKWSESVILGISPWHGRVWWANEKVAEQAMAPGMVLPASVHGGPGRAGGGEELGALRGISSYMQRTAIQGFQGFVAAAFG
jgi:3,4-dehydroadipyl-CoA semialdehyde dehydrogenase